MTEVAYAAERRTTLTDAELAALHADALDDGHGAVATLLVAGRCPTCEHMTRQVVPVRVLTVERAAADAAGAAGEVVLESAATMSVGLDGATRVSVARHPSEVPVVVTCACASEHTGAAGKFGCGRSWMVRVGFDPTQPGSATVSRATEKDLSLWPVVVQMAAAGKDPVKLVREAADKWQKALAAILGTITVVAAVGGRDGLGKIKDPYDLIVTAGVVLFLVISAGATYLAHQAAIGIPTFSALHSNNDVERWVSEPFAHAKVATDRLKNAIAASVAAFVVGLAAMVVYWSAPSAATPAPKVKATFTTDETPCGTLLSIDDNVTLRTGDGKKVSHPTGTLASLSPVAAC